MVPCSFHLPLWPVVGVVLTDDGCRPVQRPSKTSLPTRMQTPSLGTRQLSTASLEHWSKRPPNRRQAPRRPNHSLNTSSTARSFSTHLARRHQKGRPAAVEACTPPAGRTGITKRTGCGATSIPGRRVKGSMWW